MINMEKNYNEIAKQLRIILVSIYVIAGIIVAVFETGLVSKGLVSDKSTVYILEVIGVVMSLGLIPISLRGFKKTVSRIAEKQSDSKVKFYMTITLLRLFAFFVVIEYGIVMFYLVNDTIGLYCAVIGFFCSLFCFPSVGQVEYELGSEE